jgi:hypothetical protein
MNLAPSFQQHGLLFFHDLHGAPEIGAVMPTAESNSGAPSAPARLIWLRRHRKRGHERAHGHR